MLVIKIGGPAYRIGMGGGAASSVPSGGSSRAELDFNAVQVSKGCTTELCNAICSASQVVFADTGLKLDPFKSILVLINMRSCQKTHADFICCTDDPPADAMQPCCPANPLSSLVTVQPGDAEMSNKPWQVVRACVESGPTNSAQQTHANLLYCKPLEQSCCTAARRCRDV